MSRSEGGLRGHRTRRGAKVEGPVKFPGEALGNTREGESGKPGSNWVSGKRILRGEGLQKVRWRLPEAATRREEGSRWTSQKPSQRLGGRLLHLEQLLGPAGRGYSPAEGWGPVGPLATEQKSLSSGRSTRDVERQEAAQVAAGRSRRTGLKGRSPKGAQGPTRVVSERTHWARYRGLHWGEAECRAPT